MSTSIDTRIGERIRHLRAAKGQTLESLAQRVDVSRAMLSRVERGESSPTAQLLNKICGGLGITLSVLFAEPSTKPLARRAEQPVWRDPASGYLRRNVSPPSASDAIDIVEVEFPPGETVTLDNLQLSAIQQQVWLLSGALQVTVGAETHRLEAGDCLAMRLDQPIRYHNPTDVSARYAVIIHHGSRA